MFVMCTGDLQAVYTGIDTYTHKTDLDQWLGGSQSLAENQCDLN
jgi:hypothetical protein